MPPLWLQALRGLVHTRCVGRADYAPSAVSALRQTDDHVGVRQRRVMVSPNKTDLAVILEKRKKWLDIADRYDRIFCNTKPITKEPQWEYLKDCSTRASAPV
jgi:hypothetical protein